MRSLIKIINGQNNSTDEIMQLQCDLFSRPGIDKDNNEDSYLVDKNDNFCECKSTQLFSSDTMHIFAVFDGVTAGGNGKKSSEMAARYLKDAIDYDMRGFDESFISAIDSTIKGINSRMYKTFLEYPEAKFGTTMAMIIIYKSHCVVYNVGDSRVYRLTDGSLVQLSYDHTIENYKRQLGFLKKDPYISKKDGSILYQCLGKNESIDYYKYGPFELQPNDKLFICSDGIYNTLDKECFVSLLQSGQDRTVLNLAEAARESGSIDDQTGILISVR